MSSDYQVTRDHKPVGEGADHSVPTSPVKEIDPSPKKTEEPAGLVGKFFKAKKDKVSDKDLE